MTGNIKNSFTFKAYLSYVFAYLVPIICLVVIYIDIRNIHKGLNTKSNPTYNLPLRQIDLTFKDWQRESEIIANNSYYKPSANYTNYYEQILSLYLDVYQNAVVESWQDIIADNKNKLKDINNDIITLNKNNIARQELFEVSLAELDTKINADLQALQAIYKQAKISQMLYHTADLSNKYQQLHTDVTNFYYSSKSESQNNSRATILAMDGIVDKIVIKNDQQAIQTLARLKGFLAQYYNKFNKLETLTAEISNNRAKIKEIDFDDLNIVIKIPTFQKIVSGSDPYLISRAISRMSSIAFLCIIILVCAMVFAITHVYFSYSRPLRVLSHYCSHSFITSSKKPVPLQNRRDEFGALAISMQAMIERVLYSANPNKDITHATGDLATNAKPVQKLNNLPAKSAYFITKELDKLHIKANDVIMANNNLHEAYNCSITIIANTREITDAFEQKLTSLGVSISSLTEALIDVYEANKVSYDNINVCSSHLQNSQHIITSLYGNIASVVKSLNESKSREAAKYLTKIKDLQRQIYSLQVMIDKSTKAIDTCKTDIKTNVENISTTTATMHDINNANKACHRDFRDVSEKVHKMSLASYEMSEQIAIFKNKTMELQQQAYNIGNKPVS